MPRGVPKSGKRAAGGGRPRKFGEETKAIRAPISIADKLSDLYLFLSELDTEIQEWELLISAIDLKKNPRYSHAKHLTDSIRAKIASLNIDFSKSEN